MREIEHDAYLTISRPVCSDGSKYIRISIGDRDANIEFLELNVSFENFTEALTGLAHSDCVMFIRGLDNVGKKKEFKIIEFELPEEYGFRDKKAAIKEAKKHTPNGWKLDSYFGSQGSFFSKDGKQFARTSIYRWVEKEHPQPINQRR